MSELDFRFFVSAHRRRCTRKLGAARLFLRVATGYVKVSCDRIEKDPDQRVQDVLKLLFAKFAEFQSVRQVHIWLRDEGIELPVKAHNTEAEGVVWRLPAYNTVHNILTNPIYAAIMPLVARRARSVSRTVASVCGVAYVARSDECDVLIKDHHEGYISWDEFERNQRRDRPQCYEQRQRYRERCRAQRRGVAGWTCSAAVIAAANCTYTIAAIWAL